MSDSLPTSVSLLRPRGTFHRIAEANRFPWMFLALASMGFLFLVVLQCLLIVRLTYGRQETSDSGLMDRWMLPGVTTLILSFGLLNLRWAIQALRQRTFMIGYSHLSILICCGLAVVGMHGLQIAQSLSSRPITMDFSHLATSKSPVALAPSSATIKGNADEGQKLFSMSCVTCHGASGEGLNNLAPSLRESDFVKSSEEKTIARLIQVGRAIDDPANKSGKMMPAQGGNPFLTREQMAHLAVFVKSIPERQSSVPATDEAATTKVTLHRWVVPAGTNPPVGMRTLSPETDVIGMEFLRHRTLDRRRQLLNGLTYVALSLHGLLVIGVLLTGSYVLFGWLLGVHQNETRNVFRANVFGWLVAGAVWLIVLLLFQGN